MVRFTSLQGLGDDSATLQFFGNDPTPQQQPAATDSTILSFFGGVLPSETSPTASGSAPKSNTSSTLMYAAIIGASVLLFMASRR